MNDQLDSFYFSFATIRRVIFWVLYLLHCMRSRYSSPNETPLNFYDVTLRCDFTSVKWSGWWCTTFVFACFDREIMVTNLYSICNNSQQVLYQRWFWGSHKRESMQGIHPGFETQGRCHQKPKIGISVAPRKGLMSSKIFVIASLDGGVRADGLRLKGFLMMFYIH